MRFSAVFLSLLATTGLVQASNVFHFVDGQGYRDLLFGDTPVLRHMNAFDPEKREDTYKPYVHVFASDGKTLLTKGPGGKYTHHRGAFIGWKSTEFEGKAYNFWHDPNAVRQHLHYVATEEKADDGGATMVSLTDWLTPDGKPAVHEKQRIDVSRLGEGIYQLDFTFTLEAPNGPVKLGGDAQHAGFHFRTALEVEETKGATYVRPAGAVDKKNDVWAECPWVVCRFTVAGRRYAVMQMDHASNPRPTVFSTRDYGRFGAFFTATLTPDQPVKLRYRLLVEDAVNADKEEWGKRYEEFSALK